MVMLLLSKDVRYSIMRTRKLHSELRLGHVEFAVAGFSGR
jgi:hypothetical protein